MRPSTSIRRDDATTGDHDDGGGVGVSRRALPPLCRRNRSDRSGINNRSARALLMIRRKNWARQSPADNAIPRGCSRLNVAGVVQIVPRRPPLPPRDDGQKSRAPHEFRATSSFPLLPRRHQHRRRHRHCPQTARRSVGRPASSQIYDGDIGADRQTSADELALIARNNRSEDDCGGRGGGGGQYGTIR